MILWLAHRWKKKEFLKIITDDHSDYFWWWFMKPQPIPNTTNTTVKGDTRIAFGKPSAHSVPKLKNIIPGKLMLFSNTANKTLNKSSIHTTHVDKCNQQSQQSKTIDSNQ